MVESRIEERWGSGFFVRYRTRREYTPHGRGAAWYGVARVV